MYALIHTGGKQQKVEEGQTLAVERLGVADGDEVTFTPILLVDGEAVISAPDDLAKTSVTATVLGEVKGPKITGFTYKNKTRVRRRWGHRQKYSEIQIKEIKKA